MHVWFNYLAYVVWPKGPEWQTWYKRLMCWGNYQAMFNYSRVERSLECFFRDLPKLIGFDFHSLTTMGWNGHFFDVWLTDDVLQCECRDFPSARLIYRQVQTKKPWPWNSISWTWRFSISGLPLWTNKRKRKKERKNELHLHLVQTITCERNLILSSKLRSLHFFIAGGNFSGSPPSSLQQPL